MFTNRLSKAHLRPFSTEARDRTDNLIVAINALRFEAYHADATEHPALDKALHILSQKLTQALLSENSHLAKSVRYDELSRVAKLTQERDDAYAYMRVQGDTIARTAQEGS